MKRIFIILFLLTFIINLQLNSIDLSKIKLPKGFKISLFAKDIITARKILVSPNGTVFVGSKNGNVYAIKDYDNDFAADKIFLIAQNLNMPVGVEYHNGSLFVSEINRILKFENIEKNLNSPPEPIVINDNFPSDRAISYEVFAEGWLLENNKSWGRPVDIEIYTDGSLLVSDDTANAVYRIYYK